MGEAQPPPYRRPPEREGRCALNGCLYIFVPSTGGDSAGAPTGITCDVWCSGDREGLNSRSRSQRRQQLRSQAITVWFSETLASPMAATRVWWLQKGALQSVAGPLPVPRDRGALTPERMLPHARIAPRPRPDLGGDEILRGVRRGRRALGEELADVPFGTDHRDLRRATSYADIAEALPQASLPPKPSSSLWRAGDTTGHPRNPTVVSASRDWRLGDTTPLCLHGGPMAAHACSPVLNSGWRMLDKQPLRLDGSMTEAATIGPQPRQHVDRRWRQGYDAPLSLVQQLDIIPEDGEPCSRPGILEDAPSSTPVRLRASRLDFDQARLEGYDGPRAVNPIKWRRGDEQPFTLDGSHASRLPRDPLQNESTWRLGDAQPWSLSGDLTPPHVRAPHTEYADDWPMGRSPTFAVRERRMAREHDELVEQLAEVRPLESRTLRVQRGERRLLD